MQARARSELQRLINAAQAFLSWWSEELIACLPESLRRITKLERDQWIMDLDGAQAHVHRVAMRGDQPGARYDFELEGESEDKTAALTALKARTGDGSELILRVPARGVLNKRIRLPLAAEENLREVLGFEMDQQTPFKADQTHFDFRVVDRDTLTQRMSVDLTVAPRKLVDGLLDKLHLLGLYPDVVDVAGQGPAIPSINLLPMERRPRATAASQRLNIALAGTAGVLALVAIATPWLQRQAAVDALEARIASVRKESDAVDKLRQQIDTLTKESRFLVEQKKAAPIAVMVLNELTRILADDTWLYQFELNGTELQMQGESSASSAIIGVVEASPAFKNAQFRSPVTQNRTTGNERFNLSADVVSGPSS